MPSGDTTDMQQPLSRSRSRLSTSWKAMADMVKLRVATSWRKTSRSRGSSTRLTSGPLRCSRWSPRIVGALRKMASEKAVANGATRSLRRRRGVSQRTRIPRPGPRRRSARASRTRRSGGLSSSRGSAAPTPGPALVMAGPSCVRCDCGPKRWTRSTSDFALAALLVIYVCTTKEGQCLAWADPSSC